MNDEYEKVLFYYIYNKRNINENYIEIVFFVISCCIFCSVVLGS